MGAVIAVVAFVVATIAGPHVISGTARADAQPAVEGAVSPVAPAGADESDSETPRAVQQRT